MSLNFRRKLSSVIWELDFIFRDDTDDLIDLAGPNGISFYIAALGWMTHESDDLCLREHQIKSISKKIHVPISECNDILKALESVGYLRRNNDLNLWFSSRLFTEGIKVIRKQSNGKLAQRLEAYLAEVSGKKRKEADDAEARGASIDKEQEKELDLNINIKEELPLGSIAFREFVFMSEIDAEVWKMKLGLPGFERACDKLNGWIGQAQGTPDFSDRKRRGRNASFAFQNWVATEVSNEGRTARKSQERTSQAAKALDLVAEFQSEGK